MRFDAYNRTNDILAIVHPELLQRWMDFTSAMGIHYTEQDSLEQLTSRGVTQNFYAFSLESTQMTREAMLDFKLAN